jgi:hypothetical protein
LPVAPLLVAPLLVAPLLVAPLLADPVPAGSLPAGALPPVPVLVDPMTGPSDGESVGLEPPVTGELDVGVAGVEEPLPGVDEDAGAFGLLAVLAGLAALVVQDGAGVALADALPLAFAEAAEVALLIVVALALPDAGAVAVVLSPGLVPPPSGPPLVPLSVALPEGVLAELAGVSLGVAEVAGLAAFVDLAGADDAEPDWHAIAGTLPWAAEVPAPAPPVAEPAGVPSPFVLCPPPLVLEMGIPTAELSWTKAARSGGTASATPMANTTHAAARAGRSSPYRQSRSCRS